MSLKTSKKKDAKRGDTVVEVLIALAIFGMIAISSVLIMNSGIAASERALELVVARNELNAQAEALRFIHSSYIAEMTLPTCDSDNAGNQCQQFEGLWRTIVSNANTSYNIPSELTSCAEVYDKGLLSKNHAFIINTRILKSDDIMGAYVSGGLLVEPILGARLVYGPSLGGSGDSTTSFTDSGILGTYTDLLLAEGIWVIAVAGPSNNYYDFYINTCWYGSGASAPTTLDAIVRLYNPNNALYNPSQV